MYQIADSVAALTILLPGSINGNKELITNIGKAVAAIKKGEHAHVQNIKTKRW